MKIRKLRHEGCNLYTKKNAIFQVDERTFYAKIEKKDATLTSKMETLIQRKRLSYAKMLYLMFHDKRMKL